MLIYSVCLNVIIKNIINHYDFISIKHKIIEHIKYYIVLHGKPVLLFT